MAFRRSPDAAAWAASVKLQEEQIAASGIPRWVLSNFRFFAQFAESGYVADMEAGRYFSVDMLNAAQLVAVVKLLLALNCREREIHSCIVGHPARESALLANGLAVPWPLDERDRGPANSC